MNDDDTSVPQGSGYAGRRRSISIVLAEDRSGGSGTPGSALVIPDNAAAMHHGNRILTAPSGYANSSAGHTPASATAAAAETAGSFPFSSTMGPANSSSSGNNAGGGGGWEDGAGGSLSAHHHRGGGGAGWNSSSGSTPAATAPPPASIGTPSFVTSGVSSTPSAHPSPLPERSSLLPTASNRLSSASGGAASGTAAASTSSPITAAAAAAAAAAGGGAGGAAAVPGAGSAATAAANTAGGNAGGQGSSLHPWRRPFSPSVPANPNATGSGGGSAGGGGSLATAAPGSLTSGSGPLGQSSRLRPSSLMYRRASNLLWAGSSSGGGSGVTPAGGAGSGSAGGGPGRVGGGGGGASGSVVTSAAAAAAATASVYTVHLPGDDGGVEMAAAQPLLCGALRMRETYKAVDKGAAENGAGVAAGGAGGGGDGTVASIGIAGGGGAGGFGGDAFRSPAASSQSTPQHPPPSALSMAGPITLQQVDGVFLFSDERTPIASWQQFCADVLALAACVQHPSCNEASSYRLQVLEEKYQLHRLHNADVEENGDRYRRGGGLFANACRVDNCVGAATVMNAQWLVEYMQRTIDEHGDDIVGTAETATPRGSTVVTNSGAGGSAAAAAAAAAAAGGGGGGGEPQTLERVCELLDFPEPYQLTVEGLGLQPSVNRALPYYDALDPTLNGGGRQSAALLRVFLTLSQGPQQQRGAYLAGAVQPCLTRNEVRTSGAQATEMTLEISGVVAQEWESTAAWVRTHELDTFRCNQFQIAFPVTNWCSRGGDLAGRGNGGGVGGSGVGGGSGGANSLGGGGGMGGVGGSGAGMGPGGPGNDQLGFPLFGVSLTGDVLGRTSGDGHSRDTRSLTGADGRGGMGGRGPVDSITGSRLAAGATSRALPPGANPEELLSYDNYQQLLDHLFLPLFMATLAPEDPKYVDLATLLQRTGAILLTGNENADVVGNTTAGGGGEVGGGRGLSAGAGGADGGGGAAAGDAMSGQRRRRPADTPYTEPVSLTFLCYYIWANLCSLNALRRRRGLNVLQLRVVASSATVPNASSPHDASLLLLSYLIADVVVDGVALDRQPVLQYLFGLHQIGVAMCPIERGSLGATSLHEHPVARLLWRGLCVSLCTRSPLYYHTSQEALLEEYTSAAKEHRLSPTDVSEMALHSVCMSSFESEVKASWIGAALLRDGWRANAVELTSVPTARLQLRFESWTAERLLMQSDTSAAAAAAAATAQVVGGGGGSAAHAGAGNVAESTDDGSGRARLDALGATTTSTSSASRQTPPSRYPSTAPLTRRPGSASPHPLHTASMAFTSGAGAAAGGGSGSLSAVHAQAPYAVIDPAVDFPRTTLVGPFDRDIQNAQLVQALHRALDLRQQYSALPLPAQPPVAAAGADDVSNVSDDVRAGWLAALTHDPQAVLPQPTQSMSWAFKRAVPPSLSASPHDKALGVRGGGGGGGGGGGAAAGARSYLHFDEDEWKYKTVEGVIVPHEVHQIPRLPQDMYHYIDFCHHVEEIRRLIDHTRVRDFALRRLQLLEHRFKLHAAVNHSRELGSTVERASHNRDFYQSTKVDNNIRMETGMTARQLLAFIVDKATHNGDDIVSHPTGKEPQTLRQLLSELHISADSLTVDDLNVQTGATSSGGGAPHNPFASEGQRQDELLTLLLKTDNQMNGRYFAELTKRTFEELSRDQHTFAESRLPVYGASAEEWALLSHWFDTHGMSSSHNQWVVQVPRIYSSLRKAGHVASFAEYLEHIFEPLWRVSLHPNRDPRLFHFVNHIAAFDCVEDERRPDMPLHLAMRAPHEWTSEEEPPYNYYLYHLYANLRSLNRFRQRRRFSVFAFRPSCGEAGGVDHLIGGFLLAQSINYGVRLADSAPLQYLFYLAQIGVTLSPLSNNTKLQLNYLHNPFPEFFRRGLRVSLGTDSPLLYHHTQEPLLEEYSIASKIWKLSPNDLSEVARNSVLLSNFSVRFKEEKLGPLYFLSSSAGNDVAKTHLSSVRVAYRFETYHTEVGYLEYISGQHFHRALLTLPMEAQCKQLCGLGDEVTARTAAGSAGGGARRSSSSGGDGGVGGRVNSTSTTARGPHAASKSGSATVGLIDATPKEADLALLEAQRSRMQRQLWELTGAVADLHRQNRMLTTKLAEEKERDQQAAQLRRQRVGDKLRELQGLMTQKEVRAATTSTVSLSSGSVVGQREHQQQPMQLQPHSSDDTPGLAHSQAGGGRRSVPSPAAKPTSQPSASFSLPPSPLSSGSLRAAMTSGRAQQATAAAAAAAGNATYPGAAAGGGGSPPPLSATPARVPSSASARGAADGIYSTVRSRKLPATQYGDAVAQTQRLLAHTESLWRASSLSASTGAAATAGGPAELGSHSSSSGGGEAERVSSRAKLPPLEAGAPQARKRWSPSPMADD